MNILMYVRAQKKRLPSSVLESIRDEVLGELDARQVNREHSVKK